MVGIWVVEPSHPINWGVQLGPIILRTDPVVCPDCNIEDALLSNMIRDIAENTAYTVRIVFWFRIASCQRLGLLEFRVLGFGGSVFF